MPEQQEVPQHVRTNRKQCISVLTAICKDTVEFCCWNKVNELDKPMKRLSATAAEHPILQLHTQTTLSCQTGTFTVLLSSCKHCSLVDVYGWPLITSKQQTGVNKVYKCYIRHLFSTLGYSYDHGCVEPCARYIICRQKQTPV